MKLGEVVAQYTLQLEADGRSPHTIRQAARHGALLERFFGDREVGELTHQDVARFLVSAMASRTSDGEVKQPASMNALRSTVRQLFGFAHAAGLSPTNPARLVRRARVGPQVPRGLSRDEVAKLRGAFARADTRAEQRDAALFTLMIDAGVRIGSALALDVGDLDLVGCEAHLRTLKGGGTQAVFLRGNVVELLAPLVARRTAGPVFTGENGDRIGSRQVHRRLGLWCRRAGLGRVASPHALRHTFAMEVYERTGDVLVVQAALGHRSIMSSCAYARASTADVRAAVLDPSAPDQAPRPSRHRATRGTSTNRDVAGRVSRRVGRIHGEHLSPGGRRRTSHCVNGGGLQGWDAEEKQSEHAELDSPRR